MKIYLHIHHLDPGEEEQEVTAALDNDGILNNYKLEGNTRDHNSIVVYIGDFQEEKIENKICDVLNSLSSKTLDTLKRLKLDISLRVEVVGNCAYFNPSLLTIAGKKGIQIYVSNFKNVKQTQQHEPRKHWP